MFLLTLFWFLLGDCTAIEAIATDPWAPWVGLALTASTGLARQYDSKDLLRQPWHLLLPPVAAVVLASMLYGVLSLVIVFKGRTPPPFLEGYWSLLGAFLCTAPIAWLYAIPVQRFLSLQGTVRAKLAMLALVAAWRVALMTRVLTVLLNDPTPGSLFLVLLVADAVALAALWATSPAGAKSTPRVLTMMGGISPYVTNKKQDDLAAHMAILMRIYGTVLLPIWLIGVCAIPLSAANWRTLLANATQVSPPNPAVWGLAAGATLVFLGLAFWKQPAQRRRSHFGKLFQAGRISEALAELSVSELSAYPAHWQPPPVADFREPPTLLTMVERALDPQVAPWVRAIYLSRFRQVLTEPLWFWPYDTELEQVIGLLQRLPNGKELAGLVLDSIANLEAVMKQEEELRREIEAKFNQEVNPSRIVPEPKLTDRRPALLAALADLAGRGNNSKRETA